MRKLVIPALLLAVLAGCAHNPPTDNHEVARDFWQSRMWQFHHQSALP